MNEISHSFFKHERIEFFFEWIQKEDWEKKNILDQDAF